MDPALPEREPRPAAIPGDGLRALAILCAIGVPTALLSFAIYRDAGALAAPVLGPWAGLAVGHRECTAGTQLPDLSRGAAVVGVAIAVGLVFARPALRLPLLVVLGAWMLAWCGLALVSMLNATS